MEKTLYLPPQRDVEVTPETQKNTEVLDAFLEDAWLSDYFTGAEPGLAAATTVVAGHESSTS